MEAFQFYSPTQIIFGRGTEEQVGEQIARRGGSRVLVVYGGQSAVKSELLSRVLASLEQSGLSCDTLGGVKPNPRLSLVLSGIQRAEAFQANFLLAIGGGSVIDTAKAIADGVANPELDLWDDLWMKKVPLERSLPVGVVLTIPAAGSESSDSAVLTKDDTLEKRGLGSDLHRPRFAILNPDLTATLPRYQVACGVVDIMSHTMDRYFNPITTNQLTDELAEGLLRVVISSGRRAMDHPGDYQAMSELMWAGSLSHNGLTGLGGKKDFAPINWAMSLVPGSILPTVPPCLPFGAAGPATVWMPMCPASPGSVSRSGDWTPPAAQSESWLYPPSMRLWISFTLWICPPASLSWAAASSLRRSWRS